MSRRKHGCRHLIQQRLKEVVIRPINDKDFRVRVPQRFCGRQALQTRRLLSRFFSFMPRLVVHAHPSRTAVRLDSAIREGSSRLDHGSDISVLEDDALAPLCLSEHNIHHCPGQVIGANHLARKQHPKNGIDRAYQSVVEIRFLPRLHGVDIRGPEKINARKASREQCLLRLALVASEGKPASSRRVRATPAQERERGVRTAITKHSRELDRVVGGYEVVGRPIPTRCRSLGNRPPRPVGECVCERGTICEVLMQTCSSFGCEMPSFLRPTDITLFTPELSRAWRRAYPPTIPVAPTMTRRFWPAIGAVSDSRKISGYSLS